MSAPYHIRTRHDNCGKTLHKACACVRAPGHEGACNCAWRNPCPPSEQSDDERVSES